MGGWRVLGLAPDGSFFNSPIDSRVVADDSVFCDFVGDFDSRVQSQLLSCFGLLSLLTSIVSQLQQWV